MDLELLLGSERDVVLELAHPRVERSVLGAQAAHHGLHISGNTQLIHAFSSVIPSFLPSTGKRRWRDPLATVSQILDLEKAACQASGKL
jgi:hypothetical protein